MSAADFRHFLQSNAAIDPHDQAATSYTGSQRRHYGVGAPALRTFVQTYVAEHRKTYTDWDWLTLLDELYGGDSIEEAACAGLLLAKLPAVRRTLPLDRFESWLGQLQGWSEVDATCAVAFSADDLLRRWPEWEPFLHKLSVDPNPNKRRASLALLIRAVRESDDLRPVDLAFELTDALKSDRDKLLTKAVSWLLREATKLHADAVRAYLDANADSLPALVVREVRTKLDTGKKVKRSGE